MSNVASQDALGSLGLKFSPLSVRILKHELVEDLCSKWVQLFHVEWLAKA
jgi:hypothetical protein